MDFVVGTCTICYLVNLFMQIFIKDCTENTAKVLSLGWIPGRVVGDVTPINVLVFTSERQQDNASAVSPSRSYRAQTR